MDYEFHTVDLAKSHIARSKHMTRPFHSSMRFHVSDSVAFLHSFSTKCDLIYLDTGDMTPIEPTAQLQLEEAKAIVQHKLVQKGGLLLIDDVRNPVALSQDPSNPWGKSKYALPYLQEHGFKVLVDEYQVLLHYDP